MPSNLTENETVKLDPESGSNTRISTSLVVIALLIVLHVGIVLHTALLKNVTHDELWHLPVGVLILQSGEFDQDVLNPPLSRMWAALPLWMSGVAAERGADGPDCGVRFVNQQAEFQRWYNWGRVIHLAWSVATVCLVARWTWELFGKSAAVLATFLYCTCPNLTAHASIVTPDLSLVCLWLAASYGLWRWAKTESWTAAVTTAVLMGLAMAAKFTAVLLYPMMLSLWFIRFVGSSREESNLSRGMLVLQSTVSILLSLAVLCATFGFTGVGVPLKEHDFRSREVQSVATLLSFAERVPLPVPSDWLRGVDAQRFVMEQRHPVFLDGQWSETGFRSYYIKTLLYKLPHSLQAVFVLAIGCLLLGGSGRRRWGLQLLLLLPVVVLIAVASLGSQQLGVRYVLPGLPLMMIFSSQVGAWTETCRPRIRRLMWCVMAAGCLLSLRHHPHHLAYFNEATGGPIGGRDHLLDSNLDWGQDLYLVRSFMDEERLDDIRLVYFGTLWPERLGINYDVPSGSGLSPGWYAVSVNFVMGRSHRVHDPEDPTRAVGYQEFAFFRSMQPVTTLGGSIDIYRISEDDVPRASQPEFE